LIVYKDSFACRDRNTIPVTIVGTKEAEGRAVRNPRVEPRAEWREETAVFVFSRNELDLITRRSRGRIEDVDVAGFSGRARAAGG